MKRQVVIKNIEGEFIRHSDKTLEGSISFLAYEDSECRYPSSRTYGFTGCGIKFMDMATDFFSIFPVRNSAFIIGRKIEVEMDEDCKQIFSIKSLDTGRVFNANKYSENKSNLSDYYN